MGTFGDFAAVCAGGAIGSAARYAMSFLNIRPKNGFPLMTLVINVLGAFAIGLIVALAARSGKLDRRLILFLKIGVCGGFTTFSSFALETYRLIQPGSAMIGILYASLSVILCVAACAAALYLAR